MKTNCTISRYSHTFILFFFTFFASQLSAQTNSCGFVSKITNGSIINLCSGTSVNLVSQPTGSGYTYQWQKQTSAGGPFADIGGASASNYSTNELGAYRLLIRKDNCTDTSSITNIIRLALEPGTISGGPTAPICPSTDAGLLTGTNAPGVDLGFVTYLWESNVNNGGWAPIAAATDVNHYVTFISSTTQFRRSVKDNCGNTAYSNIITITPTPAIGAGTIAPLSQTINLGAAAAPITSTTPATGGSGNLTYQWRSSFFESTGFTDISGATSAGYSPGVITQTTYYARVALDATCKTSNTTDVAVVFVNGGILNAGYFTSTSSCFFPGLPAAQLQSSTPSGGVAPYTIEWQSSTDNSTWMTIPGSAGSTYNPGVLSQSTYFRKKVTDAAGTIAYSGSEVISLVSTPLTPGSIRATSSVACIGSAPAIILSATPPTGFGEKLRYQWQYKVAGTDTWIDIEGSIRENYTPESIDKKTSYRRVAYDQCGSNVRSAISNEVEIDIRPALLAGDIRPAAQLIFANTVPRELQSVEAPSGGTGSYTIWWERGSLAVGPWTTIENATGLNYQPPAVNASTYFRRVVKDNNCLAIKYSYVVEVTVTNNPPLVGGRIFGSTCVFPGNRPGGLIAYATDGTPPYTYQWEQRAGFTGPFVPVPGATGAGFQPNVINETYQFRRMVMDAAGMSAYSDTITIEYHTAPLTPGTIAATTSTMLCDAATPGIIVSTASMGGFGEAARYQWQIRTEAGNWMDITGAIRENHTHTQNITERTYFRRWAFDMCGGVSRSVVSNEVVFDIIPKIAFKAGLVDGPFITCAGTAPTAIQSVLEACGSGMIKYSWEVFDGSVWKTIAGATGPSYTPTAINADTRYRRKATDACGNTGYSNVVEILIYPAIEPGLIGTTTQTICSNTAPAQIALVTNCHYTDGTVTYQWERSTTSSGPWSTIGGATAPQYQPGTLTTTEYYRLKVMSTTCSAVAYTNTATVNVSPACMPQVSSSATSFCSSSTAAINLTFSNAGSCSSTSVEWEMGTGPVGSISWKGTGITTNTLNARPLIGADATTYFRLKAMNANCNQATYSNTITIQQNSACRTAVSTDAVQVYPNPTSAGTELTIKSDLTGKNYVTLKTVLGENLKVSIVSTAQGIMKVKLPHHLASGTYFLQITNEKGKQVIEKIVLKN